MHAIRGTVALLLALFAGAAGAAQGALDEDTITRWMGAASAVRVWAETHEDETPALGDLFDSELRMPTPEDISRAYATIYAQDSGVRDVIQEHGFDSAEQWGDVSMRITLGLASLELEQNAPAMEAEMARAMAEMENNPNMPPELRAMIEQAMGSVQQLREGAREEDLPALRAKQGELRTFLEADDGGY
ncbi:MAG: hypothetical protein V2I63_04805 [Pseudomonadales bacterium]|jgi:hypothetical protein|nr:hypothetical protein [Pseudomonadales bacterium]